MKRREQYSDNQNSLDANYDLNDEGTDTVRGYDETTELFSYTEQEGGGENGDGAGAIGGILGGEGESRGEGGGGSDNETIDDFSFTPTRDVGSIGKRANPFKVYIYCYNHVYTCCVGEYFLYMGVGTGVATGTRAPPAFELAYSSE